MLSAINKFLFIFVCLGWLTGCSGLFESEELDPPREAGRPILYRVQPGDTVWEIGQRYGLSEEQLVGWNRLDDPEDLEIGQKLIVGYANTKSLIRNREAAGRSRQLINQDESRSGSAKSTSVNEARNEKNKSSGHSGELAWPMRTGRVISGFGPRSGTFHDGIDIAAGEGTPIYASHGGEVIYSDNDLGGYGNLVIVRHKSGLISVYAHNSKVYVREGETVKRGEHIADVGATGRASGPHLHFEVRVRDRQSRYVAVDPLPLLTDAKRARPRYRINEGLKSIFSRVFGNG